MGFLSPEFAGLFLLLLIPYWASWRIPAVQNLLILLVSYGILASLQRHAALALLIYTLLMHGCARLIQARRERSNSALYLGLLLALANLAYFKYFDFFRESLSAALSLWGGQAWIPAVQIVAPVGISFYTFHSVSYLVSLQRGEINTASLPDFALFLAFFPSVIAGPINRATRFLPQISTTLPRTLDDYPRALWLIALATFKVVWLGAFLATTWADPVFANPGEFHALDAWLGLTAYSWQLYLNFSGYTDLVTGLALLLGFHLPANFNAPYAATNLRHFWHRWHISLSSWIRDYLYIPLGGSQLGFTRTQINVMIAMVLSGLWHGASANFLIWGALHGAGLILLNAGDRRWGRDRIAQHAPTLANGCTLLYVTLAWVFFRCATLDDSLDFLTALFCNLDTPLQFNAPLYLLLMGLLLLAYPLLAQLARLICANIGRLHWLLLPILVAALTWISLSLSPPGIPGFIYAGF